MSHKPFKQVVNESLIQESEYRLKMVSVSRKLNNIMNLTQSEIDHLKENNICFELNNYYVGARKFYMKESGWMTLLCATPKEAGKPDKVGYSNVEHGAFNDCWYFKEAGTATIIVPDNQELENIIRELKEYK